MAERTVIWQRRPCVMLVNDMHIRFSAVCGICNLMNYICSDTESNTSIKDLCNHNVEQDLQHLCFVFTNDRRSRKPKDF